MADVYTEDNRRIAIVHGAYWLTAQAPIDIRALLDEVQRLRKTAHDPAS
ncbi:hypothetical protein [Streptomyces sp. RTd22]|nr:hypothetical protein [Streptomyces sp. RTd22]